MKIPALVLSATLAYVFCLNVYAQAFDPNNYSDLNKVRLPDSSLSKNKQQNPSFEQGALLYSVVNVGNTKTLDLEHDAEWFSIDSENAWHGNKSAKLTVKDNRDSNFLIQYNEWQQDLIASLAKSGQEPTIHNPFIASYYTQLDIDKHYTLSFYAKSDNPGQELSAYALPDYYDRSHRRSFTLTKDWKRYSFVFKPKKSYVSILFGQEFTSPAPQIMPPKTHYWLDAIQLEEGFKPTEFTIKPLVVSLGDTDRIVDVNENKKLNIQLDNFGSIVQKPKVSLEIQDYFGEVVFKEKLARKKIKPGASTHWSIDLSDNLDLRRIGLNTLRVKIKGKKFKDEEVFRYAVVEPQSVGNIQHKNIFGWGASSSVNHKASVELYRDLGFGLRVNNGDSNMQAELIDLWKLVDAPILYNTYGRWEQSLATREMAKVSEDQMDELVADMVENLQQYSGIQYVKVVNEPEHGWKNSFMYDPQQLVPFMKKLYAALKKANPDYVVVSPDLANIFQGNLDWMEELFKLGGGEAFDILSIHTYQATPEVPSLDKSLQKLIDIADRYDFDGPIWLTEGGYYLLENFPPMNMDATRFEGHFEAKMPPFTEDTTGYPVGLALGLRTLLTVLKHSERIQANTEWDWSTLGFETLNKMPRDHAIAYHALAKQLGNSRFVKEIPLAKTVKAYVFQLPDRSYKAVIWDYDMALAKEERDPRDLIFPQAEGIHAVNIFEKPLDVDTVSKSNQSIGISYMPRFINIDSEMLMNIFSNASYVEFDKSQALSVDYVLSAADLLELKLTNQFHKSVAGSLDIVVNGKNTRKEINLAPRAVESIAVQLEANSNVQDAAMKLDGVARFTETTGRVLFEAEINKNIILGVKLTKALKIDGKLDDWSDIPNFHFDKSNTIQYVKSESATSNDLAGSMRVAWSDKHLYFAFEIMDDVHRQDFSAGDMWQQDGIQIFLDTFNNGQPTDVNLEDDYAWLIAKGSEGDQAYMSYVPSWQNAFLSLGLATDAKIAVSRDEDKKLTVYEFEIGKKNLLPLNLAKNQVLGLGIFVNDSDNGKRESSMNNTEGKEAWRNPGMYSDLILTE